MRPNNETGNPGRTYRFYTGTPVFKFGEGLSYTTFNSSLSLKFRGDHNSTSAREVVDREAAVRETLTHISATKVADAIATITNSGDRSGDHIAMLFAASPFAGVDGNPIQSLISYDRVSLAPGETTSLQLPITTHALSLVDERGEGFTVDGQWQFWLGVRSEASEAMKAVLQL